MKQFFLWPLILILCGCNARPTALESACNQIRLGMRSDEVSQLFVNFKQIGKTDTATEINWATKFYSSNKTSAYQILYAPNNALALEFCTIYFDSNNFVLAYTHRLND